MNKCENDHARRGYQAGRVHSRRPVAAHISNRCFDYSNYKYDVSAKGGANEQGGRCALPCRQRFNITGIRRTPFWGGEHTFWLVLSALLTPIQPLQAKFWTKAIVLRDYPRSSAFGFAGLLSGQQWLLTKHNGCSVGIPRGAN